MSSTNDETRKSVREAYKKLAEANGPDMSDCACGCGPEVSADEVSMGLGYSNSDVTSVPEGANLGLGCGNPLAIASLEAGETVVDLGSGGGFDAMLAARAVSESGHVIGVDMTHEMIEKARTGAKTVGLENIEFRLGEIEHLPVGDARVDVVISNCVINLSPEKPKVFSDIFRVLKPGGRIAVTDMVATRPMDEKAKADSELYAGCISGASTFDELDSMLKGAGFIDISIRPVKEATEGEKTCTEEESDVAPVYSAFIEAVKPLSA